MTDLDTLARAATRELLDHSTPDVSGRFAELKSIRTRRTTAKVAAATTALVLGVGAWQLVPDRDQQIQPAPPTTELLNNGALLGIHDFTGDGDESWGTAYGSLNEHLPTDADSEPLMQFSGDGHTFYYSDDQGQLVAWDLAAGTAKVLMPCPERGCLPGTISPDGSTGLFAGDGQLVVADLATGKTSSRAVPVLDAGPMAWSPDGQTLSFVSSAGLWTMGADGSDPQLVHPASAQGTSPPFSVAWSPDGSRIGFFDVVPDAAHGTRYTLMTVRPDGSDAVTVHDAGWCQCANEPPPFLAWSPDGTLLGVATATVADGIGVYTVRPDGSDWTARSSGQWSWLSWQPVAY